MAAVVLAVATFPAAASADTRDPGAGRLQPASVIVVRGGEHDGFTRLTLDGGAGMDWSLDADGTDALITLGGAAVRLDLSRAFDRIGRDRLAELRPVDPGAADGVGLRLVLTDAHSVAAFEARPGLLVVDIRDRARTAGPAAEAGPVPPRAPSVPPAGPAPATAPATAAAGAAAAWLRAQSGDPPPPASGIGVPGAVPAAVPMGDDYGPMLDLVRNELAAQLVRAAGQSAIQIGPTAGLPASPRSPAPATVPTPAPAAAPAAAAGLSIETVVDREAGRSGPAHLATALDCLDAPSLDPANWGDPVADWADVVAARAGVLGDFDRPRPGAVEGLVRAYLTAGLGVEAAAVIAAFPGEVAAQASHLVLARVLEGEVAPDSAVARMQGCPGAAAVWAVLAAGRVAPRDTLDRAALVMAFASMPRSLRRVLGPRLAGLFLEAGEPALAATLQEVAQRGLDKADPPSVLFDATMALDAGDPEAAIALLRPLAGSVLPEGPEAALLLVEAHVVGGYPVPAALRAVLEVLAVELRGTALAPRLAAAQALAEASVGDFSAAFRFRAGVGTGLADSAAALLDQRLVGFLAADGTDAELLRYGLGAPGWRGGAAPAALRPVLARRFLDLGLPDPALAALSAQARAPGPERLLRAEARLAAGDATGALRELERIDDVAAHALRAAALAELGDIPAALAALRSAGDADTAAGLAWRSGDPDLIAIHGTAQQRAAIAAAGQGSASGRAGDAMPPTDPNERANDEPAAGPASGGEPRPDSGRETDLPGAAAAAAADAVLAGGGGVAGPAGDPDGPGPITLARDLLSSGAALREEISELLRDHPPPPVAARP